MDRFEVRASSLQRILSKKGVDAALIISPVNLFYLNDTAQKGVLYVPSSGEPRFFAIKDVERAKRESRFKCVEAKGLSSLASFLRAERVKAVGLEEDVVPVKLYKKLKLGKAFKSVDISSDVLTLRSIKDPDEVKRVKEAAKQCSEALRIAPSLIKEGVTELETAAMLEAQLKKLGHEGYLSTRSWSDTTPNLVVLSSGSMVPGRLSSVTAGPGLSRACPIGSGRKKIKRGT